MMNITTIIKEVARKRASKLCSSSCPYYYILISVLMEVIKDEIKNGKFFFADEDEVFRVFIMLIAQKGNCYGNVIRWFIPYWKYTLFGKTLRVTALEIRGDDLNEEGVSIHALLHDGDDVPLIALSAEQLLQHLMRHYYPVDTDSRANHVHLVRGKRGANEE